MKSAPSQSTPYSDRTSKSNRVYGPRPGAWVRVGAFALLALLIGSGLYTASSASSRKRLSSSPAAAGATARPESRPEAGASGALTAVPNYAAPLMPQAAPPVSVQTYAGDCTTPKTVFNLQDSDKTVCAKVTGALSYWRLIWSDSRFLAVQNSALTSGTQDVTFDLSPTSSVGDWRVILYDPFGGTVQRVASFTVVDVANPVADLSILSSSAAPEVTSGSQAIFTLEVTNYGPSAASNVQFTEPTPSQTSFASFTQLSGPIFTCNSPNAGGAGDTTCTIASLGRGESAVFLATYVVDSGTSTGAVIADSASISSDTPDSNGLNNSSSSSARVLASPCIISCPSNITTAVDPGQSGAVVTYDVPTATGSCGQVTTPDENGQLIPDVSCSNPSGSVFPVGTTNVFCVSPNGSACTFLVTVENPGGLSINLNGAGTVAVECGEDFNDPGASAVDANGQSVPVTVTPPQGFDPGDPDLGSYTITYTATQGVNSVSTTRTVNVADTTAPQITVAGANPYKIEVGSCRPFVDPGVSANDSCVGAVAVTNSISGPGGLTSVDPNTAGTYTITYTATDGSHLATATRTVLVGNFPPDEVEDTGTPTAPPIITLLGGHPNSHAIVVECGSTFDDPGATATNACGGTISYATTGTVNTHEPGTYEVTYTATDGGLSTSVTRTVTVEDTAAPNITVNGANPLTVECHSVFTDPGATAHDACAGDFAATASGSVDANTVGTYTITYTATDPHGHVAAPVTRTVNVVDTTPPTVTPPAAVTLYTGSGASSCGVTVSNLDGTLGTATASDACQGGLPATRSGVPAGNAFPVGQTTLTYSATDAHGNTGTATQVVTVLDNTPPAISCPVSITAYLPLHTSATSMAVNYTAPVGTDNCGSTTAQTAGLPSGSQFPVGTTTNTFKVTDASGNAASCSFTVTILYDFTGFFSPVNNLPTLNSVNAGRAIPVKFSLSGNKGLGIFPVGSPASGVIPCDASAPVTDLTETVTAGGSSLSYDAGSDQYNYVWKTESSWAGTCRQLVLTLNDGTTHRANFKFK
jgi:uncharacterized repeat protein (TIGR01451 family)